MNDETLVKLKDFLRVVTQSYKVTLRESREANIVLAHNFILNNIEAFQRN